LRHSAKTPPALQQAEVFDLFLFSSHSLPDCGMEKVSGSPNKTVDFFTFWQFVAGC